MSPVSELQIHVPSNMSVAMNLCILSSLGTPNQRSSFRRKTRHAPNTTTSQRDSSIRMK